MHGHTIRKIGLLAIACVLLLTLASPAAALEPQVAPSDQPADRSEGAGERSSTDDGQAESGGTDAPKAGDQRQEDAKGAEPRADNPRPGSPGMPHKQPPALTAKQQKELAKLYKNLYTNQKKLIGKYAEFGIITQEQAAMWLSRLEARYEKLKANNFMPVWRKCDQKKLPQ